MDEKQYLRDLHTETMNFFQNIFTSRKMQEKYDLIDYSNRDFVFNIIKNFNESPNAYLVKPFYEKNYSDSNVPRSIMIRRDEYGFITCKTSFDRCEPSLIDPFRFVSIIKQFIEDENIKKEMYSEKEQECESDFSL